MEDKDLKFWMQHELEAISECEMVVGFEKIKTLVIGKRYIPFFNHPKYSKTFPADKSFCIIDEENDIHCFGFSQMSEFFKIVEAQKSLDTFENKNQKHMKNRVIIQRKYTIFSGEPSERVDYLMMPKNHFGQESFSTQIDDAVLLHESQTMYQNESVTRNLRGGIDEYQQTIIPAVITVDL